MDMENQTMDEQSESVSGNDTTSKAEATSKSKSFWGEVEKTQTTIEDFGYHVKTEICKSENTVVYIATNDDDETVAIKRISVPFHKVDGGSSHKLRDEITNRIKQEMDALSRISAESGNRFVITYYDYKIVENSEKLRYDLYIRMDYLSSIGQMFTESPLRIRDLLYISIDICDALEWCHKNKRVHNNLNLNNIFSSSQGRYVLGDFAFSENRENEVQYFIAPELAFGEKPSQTSDIYSLGMVMYVLLNDGKPPFAESDSAEDIKAAVKRLKSGEVPALSDAVNHRLAEVVSKCLAPKESRYSSVEELRNALFFLLKSMPKEWLEQNLRGIPQAPLTTVEPKLKKTKKEEVGKAKSKEKKRESQKGRKVNLEPEEVALKKKNIKDYWLIIVVIVGLIAAVAIGTMALYKSGNSEIYSLIDSGEYAVAYKEISDLYDKGDNVDALVKEYINKCMADSEYKRVAQAIPLLSEDTYTDTEYYKDILTQLISAGKDKQAESIIQYLSQKNDQLDEMLKSLEE